MAVVSLAGSPVVAVEADLVARAQRDRQEFAHLYREYLPQVYRYCYRSLGSQEAAEDATCQTFTQALAALHRYKSGSFRAWLFTIAHNVVVDEARRRRPASSLDLAETLVDPAPSLTRRSSRRKRDRRSSRSRASSHRRNGRYSSCG